MKKNEVEFVEALRKVGFSRSLCESVNEIRKAIFESEEPNPDKRARFLSDKRFDIIHPFKDGWAVVEKTGPFCAGNLGGQMNKYNLVNENGKLLFPDQWLDGVDGPVEGVYRLYGWRGINYANENGVLSDRWFGSGEFFKGGYAKVKLGGKWYRLDKEGNLLDKGNNRFDSVDVFVDGCARVKVDGRYNFINEEGELLWKGEEWFNFAFDFSKGYARVKLNGKWNYIDKDGNLLWKGDKWFDGAEDFNLAGYPRVVLYEKGYNFINKEGELLWKGEKWFDGADGFEWGHAFTRVKLNGKYNFINKEGELLWKGEKWFDDADSSHYKVKLDGKSYEIDKNGKLREPLFP